MQVCWFSINELCRSQGTAPTSMAWIPEHICKPLLSRCCLPACQCKSTSSQPQLRLAAVSPASTPCIACVSKTRAAKQKNTTLVNAHRNQRACDQEHSLLHLIAVWSSESVNKVTSTVTSQNGAHTAVTQVSTQLPTTRQPDMQQLRLATVRLQPRSMHGLTEG